MTLATTYLGQQSWLVAVDMARVLIDPVLTPSFGNSDDVRFEVWPPRQIFVEDMPDIDAVVITNEHLDHFHVPSLRMIGEQIPVVVPAVLPQVCIDAILAMGRQVVMLKHGERYDVGGAALRLFQGSPDAPSWESRVSSLYASPSDGRPGIFLQSDTAVELDDQLRQCAPDVYISTHNAQVSPPGHRGAFDNLLPVGSDTSPNTLGVDILQSVLNQPLSLFPNVRYILLSGTGYLHNPRKYGKFLWSDFRQLEAVANKLTIGTRLVGLRPGDTSTFSSEVWTVDRADWIVALRDSEPEPNRHGPDDIDLNAETLPIFNNPTDEDDCALVERELNEIAPLLMLSPLGKALINTNTYLGEPTSSVRFAVCLRDFGDKEFQVFGLDINRAQFAVVDVDFRAALMSMPAGIDCHASDLVAVLRGRINVWELATSGLRQWYLTDKLDSPVAFLYTCYSEQVRPDLAEQMYRRALTARAI